MNVKLTRAEIQHLLFILQDNEYEGISYGNQEHWWKQHVSIAAKLQKAGG